MYGIFTSRRWARKPIGWRIPRPALAQCRFAFGFEWMFNIDLFYTEATARAAKLGHQQVLWLFGPNHELTEVGAMNIFMVHINEQGGKNITAEAFSFYYTYFSLKY